MSAKMLMHPKVVKLGYFKCTLRIGIGSREEGDTKRDREIELKM